jgi:hypothetical protein
LTNIAFHAKLLVQVTPFIMKMRSGLKLGAVVGLIASAAACGSEPSAQRPKFREPTDPSIPMAEVVCAGAQSIHTGETDVTGITQGARAMFEAGFRMRVGASPVNILDQDVSDGSVDVAKDSDNHDLLPEATTRSHPISGDGAFTLTVPTAGADTFEFVVEATTVAAQQACACVLNVQDAQSESEVDAAKADCESMGFDSEGGERVVTEPNGRRTWLYNPSEVCVWGRPDVDIPDVQFHSKRAHAGTVLDPNRNDCNDASGTRQQPLHAAGSQNARNDNMHSLDIHDKKLRSIAERRANNGRSPRG